MTKTNKPTSEFLDTCIIVGTLIVVLTSGFIPTLFLLRDYINELMEILIIAVGFLSLSVAFAFGIIYYLNSNEYNNCYTKQTRKYLDKTIIYLSLISMATFLYLGYILHKNSLLLSTNLGLLVVYPFLYIVLMVLILALIHLYKKIKSKLLNLD